MPDKEKKSLRVRISDHIIQVVDGLNEGLTGIAASDRKELGLSVGYVLQRFTAGRFLEGLGTEWDKLREKGRIKGDFGETDQATECFQELLDALDRDSPDHIRLNAMKNVFLNVAAESMSNRDDVLPQQYMRICRMLSSTEVLILNANFKIARSANPPGGINQYDHGHWVNAIVESSSLRFTSLVESYDQSLVDKGLISHRTHADRSGFLKTKHFRLTELGYELCRFMQDYAVQVPSPEAVPIDGDASA